jgi:predicted nuclease with RNAse H fold
MSIIGLDLAGVENRPTGFCVLTNMKVNTCTVFTDEEILQRIDWIKPCLIAIDAPLCLPREEKARKNKRVLRVR